jgi:type IV pilus assembly protein PilY1
MMNSDFRIAATLVATLSSVVWGVSSAQNTFTEDFTGASTSNAWYYFNGACLTAGNSAGTGTPGVTPGAVPSCASIANSYYAQRPDNDPVLVGGFSGVLPDPVGNGALRFTNGRPYGHNENGAIVSGTTFNAGQGVHITFKAVTYRGDSGGAGGDGADGISFYLLDASQALTTPGNGIWNGIGSFGGSLAYSCSNGNAPFEGLVGGYIGLGIDEFGNFLNGTTLEPGYTGATATGDNSALGYGYVPGRIGLRGFGSVAWAYLNATDQTDYPTILTAAQRQQAVQNTCTTGTRWNYSTPANPVNTGVAIPDYAPILGAQVVLPTTGPGAIQIANEATDTRPDGVTTQNVFLYDLKITQDGLLSLAYSANGGAFANIITNQNITATNGPLPALLRFGFAGSTGGDTNVHEILCFKAVPVAQSASSASGNLKQTSEVQTSSQAYFAYYNPNNWTGTVTAYGLVDTAGILTIRPLANWDAQCVLTGVAASSSCASTGAPGASAPQSPASRVMLTWNGRDTSASVGTAGIPFEWANLTASEQSTLDAGDATVTANRLHYLRGDRSNEINSSGAGLYRARGGVLGDIVDASPLWVGPPNSPYVLTWKDNLNPATTMPENSGQAYMTFLQAEQGRLNVVYTGANDGFLHGVRTGSEDAAGDVIANPSTPNDGVEVLAYMPGAALNSIHSSTNPALDFSNTQYAHDFFVDATPTSGDLFYGGAWHTWLVGGLGAGGAAIYALDVTNPSTTFSESNAATIVKGEWSSATISCANVANCGNNLGNTYGTPQIRRLHNGNWGVIFGNGFGSSSGDAGIYVMSLDPSTAAATFYYLSTGTGGGNGIAYVAAADLDGDHVTDYVYAGDLHGNVWRFDLTSSSTAAWGVSPGPMFKTPNGQPITTQAVLASAVVSGSLPQLIVAFGTGDRTQFSNTSATAYVSGTQSLYGVWDWNMTAWNARSSATYASLTSAQMAAVTRLSMPFTLTAGNLQQQTFTAAAAGVDTSNNPITWESCAVACNAGAFGWFANLPGTQGATTSGGAPIIEQVVSNPSLFESAFIVNSTIPASNKPLSCATPLTDEGVLYALSVTTGGTFATTSGSGAPSFASAFVNFHDTALAGLATSETGSVAVVTTNEGTTWAIGQDIAPPAAGSAAPGQTTQLQLPLNTSTSRKTWVELR